MARGRLKCTKCDRTFAMPAHLARHMSSTHGIGKKASAKARPALRKAAPKRKAVQAGAALPVAEDMTRLVADMQHCYDSLVSERSQIDAKLAAIGDAMAVMGSAPSAGVKAVSAPVRRGRPAGGGVRQGSLKSYIVKVLGQRTKPMSPREIGTKILASGYKSKAKDLTKAVSNALPQLKNVKKIGFGQYQLA